MMSPETIREVQREAAERAAAENLTPFVFWPEDEPDTGMVPFIGDFVPRGWRLVRTYFVDATGWGREDEPAMTIPAWQAEVRRVSAEYAEKPGITPGWAIVEAGQFQVVVGLFERDLYPTRQEAA